MRRGFALSLLLVLAAACGPARSAGDAPQGDVVLPGVDTAEFTPREKHEFSEYVRQLPAPCKEVAVPIAQCVLEKRACDACVPAAQAIAKAVRDGMDRGQVEAFYKERFDASGAHAIPLAGSPARGREDARVVLVEFADFECPFCQRIAPAMDQLYEQDRDKVRFVYKFLPLSMHPHGEIAARAAFAAQAQGKFWEMAKLLFAAGGRLDQPDLEGYAKEIGLDLDRFRADMMSTAATDRIAADKKLADDLGVHGTPTFFIDGRQYDAGAKMDLREWLDQEIAARK